MTEVTIAQKIFEVDALVTSIEWGGVMRAVLLAAALVALVSASANAQGTDCAGVGHGPGPGWANGNGLKAYCHGGSPSGQGICIGYAMAVAAIVVGTGVHGNCVCIPPGVSVGQLGAIMVKYLDDHPEGLHHSATSLASHAFAEAFPCPK